MESQNLILAFLATAASVSVLRPLAKFLGWVDKPGGRKQHVKVTPIIGGPAMLLGLFAGGAGTLSSDSATMLAVCMMFFVGLFDDRFDLSARFKLITQVIAAFIIVVVEGLAITDLGDLLGLGLISLGPFSVPFTILAVVGFINAINMADGADGVAGSIALVMAITLLVAAHLTELPAPPALQLLAACLVAFLIYNFPFRERRKAKLFMGDSGSLLVGTILAASVLKLALAEPSVASQSTPRIELPPILLATLVAPPVFDCLLLMGRRLSKGRSPMAPDRDHIHHIFERAGLGKRSTVLAIAGYLSLSNTISLLLWIAGVAEFVFTLVFVCAFLLQARFMLHAWKSAKWIKEKLAV